VGDYYEVVVLAVEFAIIVFVLAFFFYLLVWVMESSAACWSDISNCPLSPVISRIANDTFRVGACATLSNITA